MDFCNSAVRTLAVALALGLSACATTGSITVASSDEMKRAHALERADARGAALVRGDLDAAYEFLSEGSKILISKDNLRQRMSMVPFRAYQINEVSCEAETCRVKSKLTFDHRVMKGVTSPLTETWVIERGKLFYVFPTV
jgi:hypothetical protein